MSRRVVIVGAGMGGLSAALRLARYGLGVCVIEGRSAPGGLASGFETGGLSFDAGPYILLDRPGLEWAFRELGLDLDGCISLWRIEEVYEVELAGGESVRFHASLERTADGLERAWPGSGRRYERFVDSMRVMHSRLRPLLTIPHPRPFHLLRGGAWRAAPLLLRPLASVLDRAGLPAPVREALAIWTHVAGQDPREAPSPMAFVPALIHGPGAFLPEGGMGSIPRALAEAAARSGVEVRYGTRVRSIRSARGRVEGVETERGEIIEADAVVSNAGGPGTYVDLLQPPSARARDEASALPLQSPGACAYLAVQGEARPPYLRFHLPGRGEPCRLFIRPGVVDPAARGGEWQPARLLGPMSHAAAERGGAPAQREHLERILREPWWQRHVAAHRIEATRIPSEWGAEFHLHRDGMNPVMTARLMRAGRLPHRSPHVRGLYLAGSSTHPGQWVSFCAISGILAADCLREDLA